MNDIMTWEKLKEIENIGYHIVNQNNEIISLLKKKKTTENTNNEITEERKERKTKFERDE